MRWVVGKENDLTSRPCGVAETSQNAPGHFTLGESMRKRKNTTIRVCEWIKDEMEIAEFYGIPVNIGGVEYTSEDHSELLEVLEDVPYMKEYLDDGRGNITQINFNPVKRYK